MLGEIYDMPILVYFVKICQYFTKNARSRLHLISSLIFAHGIYPLIMKCNLFEGISSLLQNLREKTLLCIFPCEFISY